VGDHGDALPVLRGRGGEQGQHLAPGSRVQIAGGLVGEHQVGACGECAGDRDPLLLTAGELVRPVPQPVGEAQGVDQAVDPVLLLRGRPATVELERQQQVPPDVEGRHEVEGLEHEPDPAAPEHRELSVIERGDLGAAEERAAGGR
jgi:hypothetical protein